jgi:hypothetical protein
VDNTSESDLLLRAVAPKWSRLIIFLKLRGVFSKEHPAGPFRNTSCGYLCPHGQGSQSEVPAGVPVPVVWAWGPE